MGAYMRIYVAASWRNAKQPTVVTRLREENHQVYDFRNPAEGNDGFHWHDLGDKQEPAQWTAARTRQLLLHHPRAAQGFQYDFRAMLWCDACVLVEPSGRSAHMELGYCGGLGKKTFILMDDNDGPDLMMLLANELCISLDELVERLSD